MAKCSTPGCENEASGCVNESCFCAGQCRKCTECRRLKPQNDNEAWSKIRGDASAKPGSTVGPFGVTEEDIRRARGDAAPLGMPAGAMRRRVGDRYIDRTNPEHPCYRGCTRIWKETAGAWVCVNCDDPDRSRPAPSFIPGKPLDLPPMPPVPYLSSTCCPCTAPLAPGQPARVLGINCQCSCHGRSTC